MPVAQYLIFATLYSCLVWSHWRMFNLVVVDEQHNALLDPYQYMEIEMPL